MDKKEVRIVFYGTADFAVGCLQRLVEQEYNVVAVVTAPDRPSGRGYKLKPSPVKAYAEGVGLNIQTPENLKSIDFVESLRALNPTIGVVVAFRMLPEVVWSLPQWGTYNVHGSLLPKYRGAAPINWAIINSESHTGVTLFKLKHAIDTGDVLAQRSEPITSGDNFESMYNKLMACGADLLDEQLQCLIEAGGELPLTSQLDVEASHAPKLSKENTAVDWSSTARKVVDFVRGLSPIPSAYCSLTYGDGQSDEPVQVKLIACSLVKDHEGDEPTVERPVGAVVRLMKGVLMVQTGCGLVQIDQLKPAGKKLLSGRDFLNGLRDIEVQFS